jgi:hypothetical protein
VNISGIGHRSIQVEILKVNGAKAGTFPREDTVEGELEKLQQGCVCTHIPRVADAITSNGDQGAVRVVLLGQTSHTTMVWHVCFLLFARMSW